MKKNLELLPGDKLEGLRTIVSARTLIAKQRFLEENENFNDKVELLKSKINLKGKK